MARLRPTDRSKALWQRANRMRPFFAKLRRRRRYKYAAFSATGLLLGTLLHWSLATKRTYEDCILDYVSHAANQYIASAVKDACAKKYSRSPGDAMPGRAR
jgi:hypothetical protein